jgi:hypothetical protein
MYARREREREMSSLREIDRTEDKIFAAYSLGVSQESHGEATTSEQLRIVLNWSLKMYFET